MLTLLAQPDLPSELVVHAAWVIGTAAKNDKVVQDACVAQGAIGGLVDILRSSDMFNVCRRGDEKENGSSQGGSVCSADAVIAKSIYAISAIVRGHASAQKALLLADGLKGIVDALSR